jgi:Tfp pilus assembly protein PilF
MKNSLKIFSFILVANTIAGCATAQKEAKIEMEAMPTKIHHSDESAEGHYKRGRYLQGAQRSDQALQAYQDALKLEPNDIKVHIAVAALYAERGDYATSISQLKGLAEKLPDDASLYNNLGYTYYLSGDYKAAASTLGKAIVMDSTNVHALNNMGAVLNKLGKTDQALKYIALAKTIKTGKIRPTNSQTASSGNEKPSPAMNQQAQAVQSSANRPLEKKQLVEKGQSANETVMDKNSQTEIRQVNSGIYEIVKAEVLAKTVVIDAPANAPLPEVKLLAQSGGVSFKIDPMVNKLFNENVSAVANNSSLSNKVFSFKIVNGNGVKGFAKKTGETLSEFGLNQPQQIASKKHYNQFQTVLQYRVGYLEEAVQLAKMLNKMPVLVKINPISNGADLCLVLGRDVINPHYKQKKNAVKMDEV